MIRSILLMLVALAMAAPSLSHDLVAVSTVAELETALEEGQTRIIGSAGFGPLPITPAQTWDLTNYAAGTTVSISELFISLGADISFTNVPDNFVLNYYGNVSVVAAVSRTISSDNATSLMQFNIIKTSVATGGTLTLEQINSEMNSVKGLGVADAIGTLTVGGGVPGTITQIPWAYQYSERPRVGSWVSELDLNQGSIISHLGVVYRCFAATCAGASGDPLANPGEWAVIDSNDLETHDPPNVADGEVYVGTGPSTGAWRDLVEADVIDLTHFAPSTIDTDYSTETVTSAWDFSTSLKIPSSDVPALSAEGELEIDNSGDVTNITTGVLNYHDDIAEYFVFGVREYATVDGAFQTHNATNDDVQWASLSGDATMTNAGVVTVVDDLHAHTTTSVSGLVEADIGDLAHTTDTGPSPDCSGTSTYQDGEGGCDAVGGDISGGLDAVVVGDDSHAHTGTTISGLVDADITFTAPALAAATATKAALNNDSTLVATTSWVQDETVAAGDVTGTLSTGLTIGTGVVDPAMLAKQTKSMYWGAGSITADGTNCANPAEVTIGSWGKTSTIICTDNDGSTMTGTTVMPDGWDASTVTFELSYIQDAADTAVLNADVAARCAGATETPAAYGTEIAIDDAAVTGTDAVDMTTSAAVTAAGTCTAGDMLQWQIQLDATGTTTAVATLNFVGVKMEFGWTAQD